MATMAVDFENSFIFILLSLFSLVYLALFFFKKPKDSRVGYVLPPSPPSLPIIGHLHLLQSVLPHKSFQKISSKYGPFLRLRIFNVPIVLVSSASVVYEIFKTHDVSFASRGYGPIDESLFLGSSGFIVAPYGDQWRFMKKLVATKLLGTQALQRFRGARADELDRFRAKLVDKAMKKESFEIAKEAAKMSNNSICKMIMGRSCEDTEAERVRGLVSESFAMLSKMFLARILRKPLEKLGISLFKKEIMGVSNKFDELLERFLAEHEEKVDEKRLEKDMMDTMLEAYKDENAEYKITRNHVKSCSVDLIAAGTETSAGSTQWAMAEIINNPHVLERLREEIDCVVGKTRLIQESDLPNLPYLQAVVKETLRLHPAAPIYPRKVLEGCNIGGFYIPKNTEIVINCYAVMRDPVVWEDPHEFKPERFLASSVSGKEEEKEQALKYIPFGGGRRGCPGMNLAYIFVGTAVGMMVQGFDWKIEGDNDKISMEEVVVGMSLTMAHPPKIVPVARTLNL